MKIVLFSFILVVAVMMVKATGLTKEDVLPWQFTDPQARIPFGKPVPFNLQ